jgi:hypothetical protein
VHLDTAITAPSEFVSQWGHIGLSHEVLHFQLVGHLLTMTSRTNMSKSGQRTKNNENNENNAANSISTFRSI